MHDLRLFLSSDLEKARCAALVTLHFKGQAVGFRKAPGVIYSGPPYPLHC